MIGAILGAGVGLAGSVIGGAKAASEQRKANEALSKQHTQTMDALRKRASEDGLHTATAQAALTKARDIFNDNISRAVGSQAVMGNTEAAVAAAKEQANAALAGTMSDMAVDAERSRKAAEDAMVAENQNYAAQKAGIHNQAASANTQAASQAMQAGIGLVTADMDAKLATGKGLFGDGKGQDYSDILNRAEQLRMGKDGVFTKLFL